MTKRTLTATPRGRAIPGALCPACSATLHYHTGRRLTCSAGDCPWAVTLTPQEHLDMAWYGEMPDMLDTPIETFIARIAQRVAVVDKPAEQQLIGTKPHGGESFKWRIISDETDPRKRLELKADQFEVNGGRLVKHGHCLLATSQEMDGEGRPWTEYHLCPQRGGTWTCDCRWQGFCAHLAGFWRHLQRQLAEPGYPQRDQALRTVAQLERQAGVFAVTRASRPPAEVQALGAAASADLYGV